MLFDMGIDIENIKDVKGKIAASQEMTRAWLAKALYVGGGLVFLIAMFIPVFTDLEYADLNSFVTPVIALMSAVLGYYFGKQNG